MDRIAVGFVASGIRWFCETCSFLIENSGYARWVVDVSGFKEICSTNIVSRKSRGSRALFSTGSPRSNMERSHKSYSRCRTVKQISYPN